MKYKGHPRFYKLIKELVDLHDRKNQNYAETNEPLSNFRLSGQFNIPPHLGVLVRMSDKWSRLVQLANDKPDLVGESLIDTVKDLAIYSLIFIILYEEHKAKDRH